MRARFGIAAALTRAWVRLYTIRMPLDLRETRRAEIDADLWEHEKDAQEAGMPPVITEMEILLRAVLGVPDDVSWRFEAIQARRAASLEGRIPMMAFSVRQIRWMGLVGMGGGILWAGRYFVPVALEPERAVRGYGHLALSVLLVVGLVGFYAQQRDRVGKAGKAGFVLLFTSFLAWPALLILFVFGVEENTLVMGVLALAFAFLLAPGFLLLGLGLKDHTRAVPLAIGTVMFVLWLLPRAALVHYFPLAAAFLYGGNSPPGAFLMGIGLTLMGYSVFRKAAAPPAPALSRQ
jgi:hypothetical protein